MTATAVLMDISLEGLLGQRFVHCSLHIIGVCFFMFDDSYLRVLRPIACTAFYLLASVFCLLAKP